MSSEADDKARRDQLGIEPTIPATDLRASLPDLSHERRPPDGDGGGPTVWVIVGLVAAVAIAFWWLTGKRTAAPAPAATPAPATSPKPAATPASAPPATAPADDTSTHKTVAHAKKHKKKGKPSKHKDARLPHLPTPPPAPSDP